MKVQNYLQSRKSAMTAITDLDAHAFLIVPARTFEDPRIGQVFISFLELSCTFLAEVHSGDTLYPALTIIGLESNGDDGIVVTAVTVHNQRGQLVLSGQHKYLLRRQRAEQNGDGWRTPVATVRSRRTDPADLNPGGATFR
jgi:hypothetical protein